jgi:probable rRNA maturation factor
MISSVEINVLIDEGLGDCLEASWLRSVAEQALVAQGAGSGAEMGLVITTQEEVQRLNQIYRGRDEPTDVLAFFMLPEVNFSPFVTPPDGMLHLGEVIISYPQAVIQAGERQHSIKKEIAILIIHGVLHLLGYEDEMPEVKRRMKAREEEILSDIEWRPD